MFEEAEGALVDEQEVQDLVAERLTPEEFKKRVRDRQAALDGERGGGLGE